MRAIKALSVLFAALLATSALAQGLSGSVEIAGRSVSAHENINGAGEYRTQEAGGELRIDLEALYEDFYLDLVADLRDTADQKTTLDFELGRTLRSHTTFTRLPHNLTHDPLDNLRGAVKESVATWSTDLDPGALYGIRYDVFENRNDLQFPGAGWLTISTHVRQQWREGHKQSLSVSHCSTCHVQSQGREVDEYTRDAGLSARAAFGDWSITGGYSERSFRERGETPTRLYELAEHPVQRKPLFDDRVQYDSRDGALPYDWVPTSERKTGTFEIANGDLGGFALSLRGVNSRVTNQHTDNEVKYDGFGFTLGRKIGLKGSFSLRGRTYSISSTDYFVDTEEPAAVAGPYAGMTYQQKYGLDPDFLRQSAVDRDVIELAARLSQRFGRRSSVTVSYDARNIDRSSYQVAPGETATLEQKFRLTYATRSSKGLSFRAAATWSVIRHPFMIIDAACNPEEMQIVPAASPLVPGSTQYFQIHDARVADLTASPASYLEVRANSSYQLSTNSVVTVMYRWWDGSNHEYDLTDWSRTSHAVTAALALAPAEKWQLFFATTYGKRKVDTHICIPLMDG